MSNRTEIKLNSIQNQLELLKMLQGRHSTWASENLDFEIRQAHAEIIELLEQAMKEYRVLLKLYARDYK